MRWKFAIIPIFPFLNNPKWSRSVLQDGSRSLVLFWKKKNPSYNRRNTVISQGINYYTNFHFVTRLSVIFGYCQDSCILHRLWCPWKMASCSDCPCDYDSCRESQQEAQSHGQCTQGINESASFRFLQRLSIIFGFRQDCLVSCFLLRLLCLGNSFLQRLSVWFSFLPRVLAGSRIRWTVSAGSHFSWMVVSAGSKRSQTVSAEAKYDGQSLQEAKIGGLLVYPVV